MKLDAVGVASSDIKKTIKFYELLGFEFPKEHDGGHVEAVTSPGSARLMIDSVEIIKEIIGEDPVPSNHSGFALQYESADKVDEVAKKVKEGGFTVVKIPWDAFWGQRYCVVQDPDGYKVDLYASL